MRTADVLVPTVTDRIDAGLIAQAGEQMKLIANFGNGVDNIDVASALRRGITVTNTPGVLTEDTADMTMALILAVARRLVEGAQRHSATANGPAGARPGCSATASPASGSASSAWAASARRSPAAPTPSACRSTITTAAASPARSRSSWRRPIGKRSTRCWRAWTSSRSIARTRRRPIICCRRAGWRICGRRPFVVNTARGEIDRRERAGADARGGRNGRRRPRRVRTRAGGVARNLLKLAQTGKVMLLPHMGSATIEGRIDMGEKVIINIKTFMDGHRPPDRVLPSML